MHGRAEAYAAGLPRHRVDHQALAAVVARAVLRVADQLPRGLHRLERSGRAAGVGMRGPRETAVRPAQLLLADGRADAEHLVGARRGGTVGHGSRH